METVQIDRKLLFALCMAARGHNTEAAMTTIQIYIDTELELERVEKAKADKEAAAQVKAAMEVAAEKEQALAEEARVKAEAEATPKAHVEHPLHLTSDKPAPLPHEDFAPGFPVPEESRHTLESTAQGETMQQIIDRRRLEREREGGV